MIQATAFWDKIAPRYAKSPIKNVPAYELTMARTQSYLKATDEALEVGCGTGSTALLLAPAVAQITGTDISRGMIDIARSKANTQGSENTAFEVAGVTEPMDRTFDVVLGFNLLHLVPDPDDALSRLARNLKPGGYLITKTTCLGNSGVFLRTMIAVMQFLGKAPFVNYLTEDSLDRAITSAGFEIVETAYHPAPRNRFVVARKL